MRTTYALPLAAVVLAVMSGCGSSEASSTGAIAAQRDPSNEDLLAKPLAGVTNCPSGASFGSVADYDASGGEITAEKAISSLTRQVGLEWRSALQPQTIASSSTRIVVEYSIDSIVIARGAVILVDGKWQTEGLSQCSKNPAATVTRSTDAAVTATTQGTDAWPTLDAEDSSAWPCFAHLADPARQGDSSYRGDLVGLSVHEVRRMANGSGPEAERFRLLGEDGGCIQALTADYRSTRINIFARHGRVIWAANY